MKGRRKHSGPFVSDLPVGHGGRGSFIAKGDYCYDVRLFGLLHSGGISGVSVQPSASSQRSVAVARGSDDLRICNDDLGDSFVRSPPRFVQLAPYAIERLVCHSRWSFARINVGGAWRLLTRRTFFWMAPHRDCTAYTETQTVGAGLER